MAKDLTEFEQQHFVVQQVDEPSMSKSLDRLAMELSVSVAYLSFGDFGTKPEIENKILNFRKGIKRKRPEDLDRLHFRSSLNVIRLSKPYHVWLIIQNTTV